MCRSCERWNLSPIDERWEAIEECERLFRDTKLRVSTDNIGLARLKEGTTLVRVGDPQRPEMAAWRYGDQFHRRRRKYTVIAGSGIVAFGAIAIGGLATGVLSVASLNTLYQFSKMPRHRASVRLPVNGKLLKLSQAMVDAATLLPDRDGRPELTVQHKPLTSKWIRDGERRVVLSGDEAIRAARHLLPRINRAGGTKADVAEAVRVLETSSDQTMLFRRFAKVSASDREKPLSLSALRAPVRLALEMSLHEEDERRSLEGELALLEDRWREAEEVAAISDDMFLPATVRTMMDRIKSRER